MQRTEEHYRRRRHRRRTTTEGCQWWRRTRAGRTMLWLGTMAVLWMQRSENGDERVVEWDSSEVVAAVEAARLSRSKASRINDNKYRCVSASLTCLSTGYVTVDSAGERPRSTVISSAQMSSSRH